VSALVALIAPCILIAAQGTLALNEAVSQKGLVLLAKRLYGRPLLQVAVLVQLCKDVLCNIGLLPRRGPAEDVKSNLEPVVDLGVDLVVLVA